MFWQNFWPNFASDLIAGAILGAIVALVIQNWQKIGTQRRVRSHLLILIKKELMSNYEGLEKRLKSLRVTARGELPGLKNEYWNVMSKTGGLSSITEDSKMMERLSKVYHLVSAVKQIEDAYYLSLVYNTARSEPVKTDLVNGYLTFKDYMTKLIATDEFSSIPYQIVSEVEIFHGSG